MLYKITYKLATMIGAVTKSKMGVFLSWSGNLGKASLKCSGN